MITMGLLVSGKAEFTLQNIHFPSDQLSIKKTTFDRVDFLIRTIKYSSILIQKKFSMRFNLMAVLGKVCWIFPINTFVSPKWPVQGLFRSFQSIILVELGYSMPGAIRFLFLIFYPLAIGIIMLHVMFIHEHILFVAVGHFGHMRLSAYSSMFMVPFAPNLSSSLASKLNEPCMTLFGSFLKLQVSIYISGYPLFLLL